MDFDLSCGGEVGSMVFFEKKNQRTFTRGRARCDWRGPQEIKVFCFFFSKKKSFLSASGNI
jgi:hypothetical protein